MLSQGDRPQSPCTLYRCLTCWTMDMDDTATLEKGEPMATIKSVNNAQELTVITLPMVQKATEEDGVLVKLVEQIGRGFPESQHDIDDSIREYHKFRHSLHVMDGVACYKGRLIIPAILRKEILGAIHAAHQGVSSMNNRVEQSVFWPGITVDIVNSRHTCGTCIREAPSQPAGMPVPPPVAEYPFQMVFGSIVPRQIPESTAWWKVVFSFVCVS